MKHGQKSKFGEEYVRKYLMKKGWRVEPCKKGADWTATKRGKKMLVEVKTTHKLDGGVPDMFETEYRQMKTGWYFVPDVLYIVRLDALDKPVQLDIVTKKEVDRYAKEHRAVVHIKSSKISAALKRGDIGDIISLR